MPVLNRRVLRNQGYVIVRAQPQTVVSKQAQVGALDLGSIGIGIIIGTIIVAPFVWTALGRATFRYGVKKGAKYVEKKAKEYIEKK